MPKFLDQNPCTATPDAAPDWTAGLATFDVTELRPVLESHEAPRDGSDLLADDRRHVRRAVAREYRDLRSVANAAKALGSLPAPGTSLHVVVKGNFSFADLLPAVLELAKPATFARLDLCTLGFSARNVRLILDLIDAGKIGELRFVCSCYFKSMVDGGDIVASLTDELAARGPQYRLASIRSHVKVFNMQMSDGSCYCLETSANLRSARTLEQAVLTNDPGLVRFYQGVIDEVFAHAT